MNQPPYGRRWAFWSWLALGWAVIAYGVFGLVTKARSTVPGNWVLWFAGSLTGHDLVLAPIVLGAGVLVARRVRGLLRAPVQAGLIVSAVVLLLSIPYVRGYGARPLNPSHLPQNYALNVGILVAAIWLAMGAWAAVRFLRRR